MAVRLVHNEYDLEEVLDRLGGDRSLIARDFALMTIAARLSATYGSELCFKGGFVLRHVHKHERFSGDIDSTRTEPPKHKLDAEEVAHEIARASMGRLITLRPAPPKTDGKYSLDFDRVGFEGPLGRGNVAVEISYREDVLDPRVERIGPPYYEPFPIHVLSLDEIVAEKLRALSQRNRPTDLADQAMILARGEHDPDRVRGFAAEKFKLVKNGDHFDRIAVVIERMETTYAQVVPDLAPDAPPYDEAARVVLAELRGLLP